MVGHGDDFIDAFAEALKRKYHQHRPEKGDTWLGCDLDFMYDKLAEEHQEIQDLRLPDLTDPVRRRDPVPAHPSHEFKDELEDVALVSAMIWWRENGQTTVHIPPPR